MPLGWEVCFEMNLGGGALKVDLGSAWSDSGIVDALGRV